MTEGDYVRFFAEDAATGGGSNLLSFLPIIAIVVLMYFLLIRPQSKRRKDAQAMQSHLGHGDQVQTVGGLFGVVTAIDDDAVTIEAAPGVELRFGRGAIARVVTRKDAPEIDDENAEAAKTIEQG
jgi:preprotein translocase subunit YajC